MNEPTMVEAAATTTNAAPPSSAPEGVAATAEKLYGDGQKPNATQEPQAAKAAAAETVASDQPAAEVKAEAKPQAAPEKYEFKAPEGKQFDAEVLSTYSEVARELNLSQEAAQRVLDAMAPKMAERQVAQIEAIRTEWANTSKTDKEFGGEKLSENLSTAKKALDAFGTTELRTLLN